MNSFNYPLLSLFRLRIVFICTLSTASFNYGGEVNEVLFMSTDVDSKMVFSLFYFSPKTESSLVIGAISNVTPSSPTFYPNSY